MDMKGHILAALQEKFVDWKGLLENLSEDQLTVPLEPTQWSVKDNVIHLYAWQLRTQARLQAALLDRKPEFPAWPAELMEDIDRINHWIYESYSDLPWVEAYSRWSTLYKQILETAARIPEKELLDTEKYPWLEGYSLAGFLLGTYDHHQEHYLSLRAWLEEQK